MPKDKETTMRYYNGQLARYYYRIGDINKCYKTLLISEITYKNVGLFLTAWNSWLRNYVLKHFNVSGINGR